MPIKVIVTGGDGMMGQTIKKLTIESNYIYKFILKLHNLCNNLIYVCIFTY